MSKAEDLASGTFYLTVMQAAQYAAIFLFYLVIARTLCPSEVGCFSLLLMVLTVFSTVSLVALNNAVIRYVSESLGRSDLKNAYSATFSSLKLVLLFSTLALAIGLAISPLIANFTETGLLEVSFMLASGFLLNFTSFFGAVMYGYSMFRMVCLQNAVYIVSCRFIGLLLAVLGLRVLGLSLGFFAGSFLTLILSLFILRGRLGRADKPFPYLRLLGFSLPVYGVNVLILVQSWLDVALLSGFANLDAAGTYYIAVSSVAPLSILWMPLSQALLPTLSWMNGSENTGGMEMLNKQVLRVATAIILPLSFALASVSSTALSIVYGQEYGVAGLAFAVLAFSAILTAYASIYGSALQAAGRTKPLLTAYGVSILAYAVVLLAFAGPLRHVGAALARAAMYFACIDFGLCMNQEFLREGFALHDTLHPDRIIIGEYDKKSGDALEDLYRDFYGEEMPPLIRTNLPTAELIKYANNAFLAAKVSFINQIANICEKIQGADVITVAKGIGLD